MSKRERVLDLGPILAAILLALAACSSTEDGDGSGGAGGTAQGGAGTGAGGSAGVVCDGASHVFPSFDKTCGDEGDCATVYHQVDCCGTLAAIGINVAEEAAFDAAEAACVAQYPGCGCSPNQTIAEDGDRTEGSILIECASGACSTYVP